MTIRYRPIQDIQRPILEHLLMPEPVIRLPSNAPMAARPISAVRLRRSLSLKPSFVHVEAKGVSGASQPRHALLTLGGCASLRNIRVAALLCSGAFQTTPLSDGAVNTTVEQGRPAASNLRAMKSLSPRS
jgi:hypothetical protein